MAEKGGSRTLRGPDGPQTGFEDQRHHRAPSFSTKSSGHSMLVAREPPSRRLLKIAAHCASLLVMSEASTRLRRLPSVDRLLTHPRTEVWLASLSREYVTRCCREGLEHVRATIARGDLVAETL